MAEQKYDWTRMIEAAKRAGGEWVLAFEGAPSSLVKRIRNRDAAALYPLPKRALSVAQRNVRTDTDGAKIADVYVRWNLDAEGNPRPALLTGSGIQATAGGSGRSMRVSKSSRRVIDLVAKKRDLKPTAILNEIVTSYAGGESISLPDYQGTMRTTVTEATLKLARERAESEGKPVGTALSEHIQAWVAKQFEVIS